jgi:hypothetical protein
MPSFTRTGTRRSTLLPLLPIFGRSKSPCYKSSTGAMRLLRTVEGRAVG